MDLDADLARTTATALMAGLKKKAFSALELCEACIRRIETFDPKINAVIVRDFDRARAEARAADNLMARGETKPLLGVPMTIKESYDLRGYPTTWGFPEFMEHRAREDALAVQRLKAAGAVVLGKTNVPPALGDWQAVNPIYGRTNNPHDPARSPGGSSGGSAASIAMGFSALEIGSDIGGSIRVPAAFCGVYGHKTSHGVIPTGGHMYGGILAAPVLLSVLGPIARSAEDLALALDVLAGPDAESPANRLALPKPRHGRLSSFRVFALDHHPAAGMDSDIGGALESLVQRLLDEGASVAKQSSLLPDLAASWKTYQAMLHTIITRRGKSDRTPISAHAWFGHLDDQLRIRRQWAEFFRHFDIVLCPAFGTPAFPHTDEPDWRKRTLMMDGDATKYGAQLAWAGIATVANLPSTVIPLGVNAQGLPVAVQAIGPFLEDHTSIAFAGMVGHDIVTPAIAG